MEEIKKIRKGMAKANKGITLIALVITIIILIILAGVAVNLSLGENGIFNRAKTAREQYKMAEVKEKIELAIVDIQSEKMGKGEQCTIDTIISELPGKVDGLTISKDGENAKGKYNDCDFTIDPNLKLTIEGYTPSTGGGTSGGAGGSTGGDTGGSSTPTNILVDSITLNKTTLTLDEASSETLTVTISPTNATNKEVTWSTSKSSVATVDTTGKITAVAEGTATITATAKDGSGKSASCTVTVESTIKAEYVNYPIDLNGDGDTTNDWMLFYKADGNAEGEESGGAYAENVGDYYIIAADYLKNTDSRLKLSQMGTVHANGAYCISWYYEKDLPTTVQKSGTETLIVGGRTNTSTTINKLFMQNKFGALNSDNPNSRAVSALINTSNWAGYVNTSYADYAIGAPTLEMWVASWNVAYEDKLKLYTNKNSYGYYVGTNSNSITTTYQSISSVREGYKNKLYFPYQESIDGTSCYGTWVASPSAKDKETRLSVYSLGMIFDEDLYRSDLCARPVVHLKSGKTLTKNASGIWEIK